VDRVTKFKLSVHVAILFFIAMPVNHITEAAGYEHAASGKLGIVVAGKPAAVESGLGILENGGNAADAAVASILTLSVVQVGTFCIGGEVPVLVYDAARQKVTVLSGQGPAPLDNAAISWYLKNGITGSSIRLAAVPAVIDLTVTLLQQFGTISFQEAVKPTLALLDAGGPTWYVDTSDGDTIDTGRNWYVELARTLRILCAAEQKAAGNRGDKLQAVTDCFYRGEIADQLDKWYREQGGFLRKQDLAAYHTRIEEPVTANYRGYIICKCGPWTQGPFLLQSLRLLEGFNLGRIGQLSTDYIHVVTEAMKLAFADRDEYYGDPCFVNVPIPELLSEKYTSLRRSLIDMKHASLEIRPGDPLKMEAQKSTGRYVPVQGGTTTLCVADRWGNVIAATPSGLGSTAGCAGETGIIHGTRLVSLNTWPGHPNCIAPGKRPRITLTPTLVLKANKPVLAISVAGGDLQDQVTLQLILDYIEFGMNPEAAMAIPRFATRHHIGSFGQDPPDLGSLIVNKDISAKIIKDLAERGHKIIISKGGIGGAAMLSIDSATGEAEACGSAAGNAKNSHN
jgi:gamma-glutamyltranspeptidase/glutathione hydrolase